MVLFLDEMEGKGRKGLRTRKAGKHGGEQTDAHGKGGDEVEKQPSVIVPLRVMVHLPTCDVDGSQRTRP